MIRFGIAAKCPQELELRFDTEYARWSMFDTQCIVNAGKDCQLKADGSEANNPEKGQIILAILAIGTTRARCTSVSATGPASPPTFRKRGYDTSAVNRETLEATYPDAFKLLGTLGVRHKLSDRFASTHELHVRALSLAR